MHHVTDHAMHQVTLMKLTGEVMTSKGAPGRWYSSSKGDEGPIDAWCAEASATSYGQGLWARPQTLSLGLALL